METAKKGDFVKILVFRVSLSLPNYFQKIF